MRINCRGDSEALEWHHWAVITLICRTVRVLFLKVEKAKVAKGGQSPQELRKLNLAAFCRTWPSTYHILRDTFLSTQFRTFLEAKAASNCCRSEVGV